MSEERSSRWAGAHAVLARVRLDAARREAATRRRVRGEPESSPGRAARPWTGFAATPGAAGG